VKDITNIFEVLMDKAQGVAKAFKNATLQYSRLREFQMEIYGEHHALVLSVITRWGTQYRLVNGLLRSKEALKAYALRYHEAKDGVSAKFRKAIAPVTDYVFWGELEELAEILQPLDEAIKTSESQKGHLGHVLQRWQDLYRALDQTTTQFPILKELFKENGALKEQYFILT